MASQILRNSVARWFVHHHSTQGLETSAARVFICNEISLINKCFSTHRNQYHLSPRLNYRQIVPPAFVLIPNNQESQFLQRPISWSVIRTYAKKGKDKGGKGHKKVVLTSDQLEGLLDLSKVQDDMEHLVEDLKDKFIHQVSVRTSQGVFDNLIIKTPDGNFPLIQLGQVIQKSPQLIVLNLAAAPQYIGNVKEALASSGLNVNPQQDGTSLFLPLPKVTREHREALAKNAKMLSEKSKKHLRDLFSKNSKKIKSSKEGHSSDDVKAAIDMVESLMHEKINQIDSMTTLKQKELMGK